MASRDVRDIARVLRGALRLRTEIVALVEPPRSPGQHVLEIDIPDIGRISLLAEISGVARPEGFPLSVRPVTRVQMAELFSILERIDEPSNTEPPPPEELPMYSESHPPDETLFEALHSRIVLPTSHFEIPESVPPVSFERAPASREQPPSSPRQQPDPRVGRVVAGKYLIEAPIGMGAAATVYRALHKDLRRPVAIKILHAENQNESQFLRRFKAEALTASKLDHANVTRVIDFGEEDGELYLVMELVVGRSLESIIASEGPLGQRRVVDIGIQACRALVFAHGQGVIHRDIKPENVMLVPDVDDDGEPCDLVKVCDFGLAKMRDPVPGEEITIVGMLCGSPAYMSPEQTRGEPLDMRTDIYSLGVTLFEALTGALPFDAYSIAELFLKKGIEPPRRVSSIVAIDPLLDDIVYRAMATRPTDRHESAKELRIELRTAREQLEDAPDVPSIEGG
jgi:eukaryotic-like serine/threonine-protein kinase